MSGLLSPHADTLVTAGGPDRDRRTDERGGTQIDDLPTVAAAPRVVFARVTPEPIDPATHGRLVESAAAGAVVVFAGLVRNHDHGVAVAWLDYVAHPSAERVLGEIAHEIAGSFDVYAVALTHRLGRLEVGDCALAAAVSSAHRAEAFAATSALVEMVKARLPVWKRQVQLDGSVGWVNSPNPLASAPGEGR